MIPDMTPTNSPLMIEPCLENHIEGIQAIYAHFVGSSLATFETEAPTALQMLSRRADIVRGGFPYFVALQDGEVAGYAYASAYRTRVAYRYTVENSIYVAPHCHGRGIGRKLMGKLLDECRARGYQQMVAVIGDSANRPSIALHAAMGFQHVGTFRSVGRKFSRWVDTVLMQMELNGAPGTPLDDQSTAMETRQ